jgi:hypothetical protein
LKKSPALPHLHKEKEGGQYQFEKQNRTKKGAKEQKSKNNKTKKGPRSTKRYFRRHRTIKLGEALKSNITKKNAKE